MAWRPAKSLMKLREQANTLWPNRSKASDGLIGDSAHAASASDHNPNSDGVVCAFDLTHDPANGCNCDAIAESIRLNPHPDLKYLIWNHRIFRAYVKPGIPKFTWSSYTGADPHTSHIHVSVGVGPDGKSIQPYDDEVEWNLISSQSTPATVPETEDEVGIMLSRPGVILHVIGNKIVTIHTPKFFYDLAAKGVKVVECDDRQFESYTTAFGQPV